VTGQLVRARTGPGHPVERVIADVAAGRPVAVVDDEAPRAPGALVFAAERATPALMAFAVRHTSGFVCAALTGADCDRLALPPMCRSGDPSGEAYRVSVDAADGIGTGISAADRARTVRVLAGAGTGPAGLRRPGHVVPLRAWDGGVLRRAGHAEAAVDLARLAGLRPAGVLGGIVSGRPGADMARRDELDLLAAGHDLRVVTIAELVTHRRRTETQVRRVVRAHMPLAAGEFRAIGYEDLLDGAEHVAFVHGDLADGADVLVRVHAECLTGDVFGSLRCRCGDRLGSALERVVAEGRGVVLYLRAGAGADRGPARLLRTDRCHDGAGEWPADPRDHAAGAQILHDLGVRSMRLLTDDPAGDAGPAGHGPVVTARIGSPYRADPPDTPRRARR